MNRTDPPSAIRPPHRRETVLVVDDDAGVRRLLDLALSQYGFAVLTAASGTEAVEVLRQHRQAVSVVLLDGGGPATLAALRAVDPDVRCCLMSGDHGRYSQDDLLALGVTHFFPRPFAGLDELARLLRQASGPVRPE